MADEQPEIPQENYVSLRSKDTDITLNNVTIPPTKKREQKPIYLFGILNISEESSSLESEVTVMPLVDVPISPAMDTDEDLKTHSSLDTKSLETHDIEDSVSVDLSLAISGNPNIMSNVTSAGINKGLTEDGRKFKKMRSLSKEEREEEKRAGVSTELSLYNPWTIRKTLKESDINHLTRLMLDTSDAENHIMRHLSADVQKKIQEGIGVKVKAYDHDTNTEHDMVFKRHVNSSKSYVFNGGWGSEFVRRIGLKQGDVIGLFWCNFDSRLHFCVLQKKET